MVVEDWLGKDNKIGLDIYEKKYNQDETFNDFSFRVSGGNPFLGALIEQRKFIPGGRILSNRGMNDIGRKVTYSNCYVLEPPVDSIEGIFATATEMARTFSYGGGVGIDLTKLRPAGFAVNNTAKQTSGAVSFMDFYSYVTGLIGQNGRRGALMLSISCEHPDVLAFIKEKYDLTRVTKANVSVRVTDEFMRAVIDDKPFDTHFTLEDGTEFHKEISAKEVFEELVKSNHECAEPGILYWDTISRYNLMQYAQDFSYAGTNPCAEEPLPAYGSCLLGSLNLYEFVKNPHTKDAYFDYEDFKNAVKIAVVGMNEILDDGIELHPLEKQREVARDWRQIGIGIMGLADALIALGIRYGSKEAVEFSDKTGFVMANYAIRQSARLAKEFGPYPKCNIQEIIKSDFFINNTDEDTRDLVMEYGLRNSQLLTIAPTGSISTMLGVSGGIEPVFAFKHKRKTESLHSKDVSYDIVSKVLRDYIAIHGETDSLPDYFVESHEINPVNRIAMQAAWQKHIDASISSTINLKESATVQDVFSIYVEAWVKGLKGVTVYRDNCARQGILTTGDEDPDVEKPVYDHIKPVSRKQIGTTHGSTFCKKCACGTMYITINRDDDGNIVESFVNTAKTGICQANANGISRLVSLSLRSGIEVDEIVDQLRGIVCKGCTSAVGNGKKLDGISCPDIMARTILEFRNELKKEPVEKPEIVSKDVCPMCGEPVARTAGCMVCMNCGYSKCD